MLETGSRPQSSLNDVSVGVNSTRFGSELISELDRIQNSRKVILSIGSLFFSLETRQLTSLLSSFYFSASTSSTSGSKYTLRRTRRFPTTRRLEICIEGRRGGP